MKKHKVTQTDYEWIERFYDPSYNKFFKLAYLQVKREGKLFKKGWQELVINKMHKIRNAMTHLESIKLDEKGRFTKKDNIADKMELIKLFEAIKYRE